MPKLRTRGEIHTLRVRLRHLNRESLWSKPTTNTQARSEFLSAVFITVHVLCLVLPWQLVNSYRLQSNENEGASFFRNVGVCYITLYTAPHPRRVELSRRCIRYTQKYCYVFSMLCTYHVDSYFKFPSTIVQNASVINDNVQSLKCCVCFLECFCNIHNMTGLTKFSALLTFLVRNFAYFYRL